MAGQVENDYNLYLGKIRDAIERHKEYPAQARLRNQEGVVEVRFEVNGNGRVDNIEVLNSSGSRILDMSTERMLRRLRLPEPPDSIADRIAGGITVPVAYTLN
ncbi:MAG: hypothetical protein C0462_02825 [Alcanivorax sp.]|nr:hypothetical protein [Alcanivorax sp.]